MDPGVTIGGYRILSSIGQGGMAELFKAERIGPGGFRKEVAVKFVKDHLTEDPTFTHLFLQEASLAARIDHPNVVQVHDLSVEHNRLFLVMEYFPGCPLSRVQRAAQAAGRAIDPRLVVKIIADAAAGLHAAHDTTNENGELMGLVHRDVSPQNILLSVDGHVKVCDFGIAKIRTGTRSETGSLKGKIAYMSPEHASGKPLDRRSDLYALAVVLWELLANRRLFRSMSDVDLLMMVQEPQIPRLNNVDGRLSAVVAKALSTNREDRYPSAWAFRAALLSTVPEALSVEPKSIATLVGAALNRAIPTVLEQIEGKDFGTNPLNGTESLVLEESRAPVARPQQPSINTDSEHITRPFARSTSRIWPLLTGVLCTVLVAGGVWYFRSGPMMESASQPEEVPAVVVPTIPEPKNVLRPKDELAGPPTAMEEGLPDVNVPEPQGREEGQRRAEAGAIAETKEESRRKKSEERERARQKARDARRPRMVKSPMTTSPMTTSPMTTSPMTKRVKTTSENPIFFVDIP